MYQDIELISFPEPFVEGSFPEGFDQARAAFLGEPLDQKTKDAEDDNESPF
jgi:hypothetical protein